MLRIVTDGAADTLLERGVEAILSDLSISVAANLGPGTVGLIVYPVA